jgi:hypothetical protein
MSSPTRPAAIERAMNRHELQALVIRMPVEEDVGTGRLLGRTLLLPFRHPLALIACIAPPIVALGALGFFFPGWTIIGGTRRLKGVEILYPLSNDSQRTPLAFAVWLCSLLLLAFLLCCWQLAVVRRFSKAPLEWMRDAFNRIPSYACAFFIWLAATLVTYTLPLSLMGYGAMATGYGMDSDPGIAALQFLASLVDMVLAFWVAGRLTPLPALVAARGWRGALPEAWRKTRGRGGGLAFGGAGLFLLGLFGAFTAGDVISAWIPRPLDAVIIGVSNLLCTTLTLLWFASLGALLVQDPIVDYRTVEVFA